MTALFEMRPLARVGVSMKNCFSAEHSIALPNIDSSSKHLSYAATIVEIGVRLNDDVKLDACPHDIKRLTFPQTLQPPFLEE